MLQSLDTMAVGNRKQYELKASHIAGRINILPDQLSRIWIQPTKWSLEDMVLNNFIQIWGETFDRSVCSSSEQQNAYVLQLGTTSSGLCSRCFLNNLTLNVCLCISTNPPGSQGVGAHETGAVSTHSDSTTITMLRRSSHYIYKKGFVKQ